MTARRPPLVSTYRCRQGPLSSTVDAITAAVKGVR
jgi:hypothetical protein